MIKHILSGLYVRCIPMGYVGNHFAKIHFWSQLELNQLEWFWCLGLCFLWSRNSMVPFIFTSDLDLSKLWPLQSHGGFCLFFMNRRINFSFFFFTAMMSPGDPTSITLYLSIILSIRIRSGLLAFYVLYMCDCEVTDGQVVRAGVSVTWNVLSWFGGREFEPCSGGT